HQAESRLGLRLQHRARPRRRRRPLSGVGRSALTHPGRSGDGLLIRVSRHQQPAIEALASACAGRAIGAHHGSRSGLQDVSGAREGGGQIDLPRPDVLLLRGGLQAEVRPRARQVHARVTVNPPLLAGRDRYERVTEGWVDNTHDDALTHTVRLADPDLIVEAAIVASTSPSYTVPEARCRAIAGVLDDTVARGFTDLA